MPTLLDAWIDLLDATPPWKPVCAPIRSVVGQRSAAVLVSVVEQFHVETCRRYAPGGGMTWCNVFVWDATRALGAELPHWVAADGRPCKPGAGSELSANALAGWLQQHGPRLGWRPATHEQARHTASHGCPTVAIWPNPHGHGHVAIVLPSPGGAPLRIAQAGARNFSTGTLEQGFGARDVDFWFHA